MDFIKGYKPIEYTDLKDRLNKAYESSGKTYPELAVAADVTSTQTIKFVFESSEQKVSDKVLTSVSNSLDVSVFVMWLNGEKFYFAKSKN